MKAAKFALNCDGQKIRNLKDLKEHFDILDVLELFKNQTLHRWLKFNNHAQELQAIQAINAPQDLEIVCQLCQIFGVSVNRGVLEEMFAFSTPTQQTLPQTQILPPPLLEKPIY
ncbi:hypothetical protein NHP190003_07510 [Helicobacter sp. NHP19-003]|uniref:Uncharacterized protein n=1 Tax=Helicobacter gastrocanis TaxID=2849641 RepID=A0ABM7SBR1_9HELI|nr:hypothetical protein [Helicobacter sp. NHP19-003]BCZ17469.1 hypothetical protein NHP190003_07510 [Helicobacter sp. NHP19-003]